MSAVRELFWAGRKDSSLPIVSGFATSLRRVGRRGHEAILVVPRELPTSLPREGKKNARVVYSKS